MIFQTDIETISQETARLQEIIAAKEQQRNELIKIQLLASESVEKIQEILAVLKNNSEAFKTFKKGVMELFNDGDDDKDKEPPKPPEPPEPEVKETRSSEQEVEETQPTKQEVKKTQSTKTEAKPIEELYAAGDIVKSKLVPDWIYKVLEVRDNGLLLCERSVNSGERFEIELERNSIIPYLPPTLENTAPLEVEINEPEDLAALIQTLSTFEEIEAVTTKYETYKKEAWKLLSPEERNRIKLLRAEKEGNETEKIST